MPAHACIRAAIREFAALGVEPQHVFPDKTSVLAWNEVVDSPSFPSLRTKYRLYQITVRARACAVTCDERRMTVVQSQQLVRSHMLSLAHAHAARTRRRPQSRLPLCAERLTSGSRR